ncbi:hypothetical protein ACOSQ2_006468 [Xanthoceras sorbifolium]
MEIDGEEDGDVASCGDGFMLELWILETEHLHIYSLSWSRPQEGWVNLNVDSSRIRDLGNIVAGGVIRDHNRKWLKGYAINKGIGNIVEAESTHEVDTYFQRLSESESTHEVPI